MTRLVIVAILAMALSGCVRWEHDPLEIYHADPEALEIPAMTFAVIGF